MSLVGLKVKTVFHRMGQRWQIQTWEEFLLFFTEDFTLPSGIFWVDVKCAFAHIYLRCLTCAGGAISSRSLSLKSDRSTYLPVTVGHKQVDLNIKFSYGSKKSAALPETERCYAESQVRCFHKQETVGRVP